MGYYASDSMAKSTVTDAVGRTSSNTKPALLAKFDHSNRDRSPRLPDSMSNTSKLTAGFHLSFKSSSFGNLKSKKRIRS